MYMVLYCSKQQSTNFVTTLTAYETGNGRWPLFNAFKTNCFGIWVITIRDLLHNSSCTCPPYMKTMILGIHIRLHFVQAPEEAKSIPFGGKQKRGRPSKGKQALLIQ